MVSISLVGISVMLTGIFGSGIGTIRILAPNRSTKKDNLAIRIFNSTVTCKCYAYLPLTERETETTLP